MSDFENLIYFAPICGLILVCFLKCCFYNSSNDININNVNQFENINYTERIPIMNDRFPVICYTIENNNDNNNNDIDIDLENNHDLKPPKYENLENNHDLEPPKYENL